MAKELAGRFTADGIDLAKVTFERRGDLRYVGQGYELKVPFPDGTIDDNGAGQGLRGLPRDPSPRIRPSLRRLRHRDREPAAGRCRQRRQDRQADGRHGQVGRRGAGAQGTCTFRVDGKLADYPTDFYRRDLLPVGERIAGPAIVLQMDSTTVVPPQHNFEADAAGNLIIQGARHVMSTAPRRQPGPQARPHRPDHHHA